MSGTGDDALLHARVRAHTRRGSHVWIRIATPTPSITHKVEKDERVLGRWDVHLRLKWW